MTICVIVHLCLSGNSWWEGFHYVAMDLLFKSRFPLWIIRPSKILCLWKDCPMQSIWQLKECEGSSRRWRAGSGSFHALECSWIPPCRFLMVSLMLTVTASAASFIGHMWLIVVFIFLTEKAFDLFSLPKDDENVIETCECLQFGNKQIHCYIAKLFPSGIAW